MRRAPPIPPPTRLSDYLQVPAPPLSSAHSYSAVQPRQLPQRLLPARALPAEHVHAQTSRTPQHRLDLARPVSPVSPVGLSSRLVHDRLDDRRTHGTNGYTKECTPSRCR